MADAPTTYVVERKVIAGDPASAEGVQEAWTEVGRAEAKTRDEALAAGLGDPKNVVAGEYRVIPARYIGDPMTVEPEVTTTLKITSPDASKTTRVHREQAEPAAV